MRRRVLLPVAAVVFLPVVVLGVEIQLARTAPRLDDEVGFRPDALAVGAGSDPTRVLWLGDSTSTGVGTDRVEDSMAHRVTVARHEPAELTILGISGDQVHEVVDDQIPELVDRSRWTAPEPVADVVYVSIGANDVTALTRRPTFESRYRSMVDQVRGALPDAEIVLVGIPDMGTAPRLPVPLRQIAGVRAAQLDGVIEAIAADEGLHHVDLASRTSRTFSSDPDRYFSDDGFHPGAEGHRVWADAVVDSIADASR